MSHPDEWSTDNNGDRLVEPPVIDSLIRDEARAQWAISFIPEESISSREKEQITIPFDSADGKRIALQMKRLELLLNRSPLDRVFHSGEANFSFQTRSGEISQLCEAQGILATRAYVELADIAMTAQLAFMAISASAT